nr:hypothetical protein [Rhodopirellula sp. SM50]
MATSATAQFSVPEILSTHQVVLPDAANRTNGAGGSGFKATIQVSNLMGVGYVGVDVTLTSTLGPLTANRELSLRLTPIDRHLPADRAIATEFPLTFPQGQTQVVLSRSCPKWTIGNSYRIEIVEDGAPLKPYTAEVGNPFPGYAIQSPATVLPNELVCNFLLVDTDPKPIAKPADAISFDRPGRPGRSLISRRSPSMQTVSLQRLPSDWRLLRDIDCIVIQGDRLIQGHRLDAATPGQAGGTATAEREAIRDWVMMGGTLVVLQAPDATQLARSLRLKLLQQKAEDEGFAALITSVASTMDDSLKRFREALSSVSEPSQNAPLPVAPRVLSLPVGESELIGGSELAGESDSIGESELIGESDSMVLLGPSTRERFSEAQLAATGEWIAEIEARIGAFDSDWKQGYRRSVGGGQVVGIPSESIDSLLAFDLLESLIGYRCSTMLTRGVDPIMGDFRSRRWLIPGVAEPPVYTFMGILTLFVLLVGPVAYRWTTRGHRSHLMFLIAPALALVTTAAMFAYSIVSDGFGTTVRVRQLTWIDGASGDAIERTRSTLFSGISPRTGLRFAGDAEVMAYPNGGQQRWRDLSSEVGEVRLHADIDADDQRLDAAFLPSRTQTQFVTHQIRRGVGTLSINGLKPFDSSGQVPNARSIELSSSLPFELRDLVVCSPDGRYWSTDSIKAGQAASADWIPKTQDASKLLGRLYTRHRPVGAVTESGRSQGGRRIRDLVLFVNKEISRDGLVVTDGVFEHWLNESLFVRGELPAGMFIGIAAASPDVVAIADADQVASVRYVMGTLP